MKKLFLLGIIGSLLMIAFAIAEVTELAPASIDMAKKPYLDAITNTHNTKMLPQQKVAHKEQIIPIINDTETLDSIFYDGDISYALSLSGDTSGQMWCELFTPAQTCSLTAVTVGHYDPTPPGYFRIHIMTNVSNLPGAEMIAPFIVTIDTISSGNFERKTITLPTPINVGTTPFWVCVEYYRNGVAGQLTHVTVDSLPPSATLNRIKHPNGTWYSLGSWGTINIRSYVSYYGADHIFPVIAHTPISAGFTYDGNYTVKAEITDNDAIAFASVFYAINAGAFTELPMTLSSGFYTAHIPAQIPGTAVYYYISAEDPTGNTTYAPADSSDNPYGFYVYVGHELKYEEGQFYGAFYLGDTTSTDHRFAVRFTPPHYPSVITMLRYNVVDSTAFDIALSHADGIGGAPGTTFYGPEQMASPYARDNHWLTWVIPGAQLPVITSGDFYAEFKYKPGYFEPYLSADATSPDLRSYFLSNPDSGWRNVTSLDWMIRAVVVDTFFAHDVGVTNIDSLPEIGGRSYCDQQMWVNVYNFGNNTESFPVQLRVVNDTDTTIVIYNQTMNVTSLPSKTGQLLHFPTWTRMVPGDYIMSARTLLGADQYSYNNEDAWYFPVGSVFSHRWDDGMAEAFYVVSDTASANDMFAVKFTPIEPNFKVDAALIFAGADTGITTSFEWLMVCPGLTDSTPDINHPYAESLNVVVNSTADPILIDFPRDSSVTGYAGNVWVVVKWITGQTSPNMPGIYTDQTDPDRKSYWTSASTYPGWNVDGANDYVFRLYLGYTPCDSGTGPGCDYMLGDINNDNLVRGGDVTYAVRYFKGLGAVPPDSCYDVGVPTPTHWLYVGGDVNGDCKFMGSDVTRLVSYFKGVAVLSNCHFFPHPLLREQPLKDRVATKLTGNRNRVLDNHMPKAAFIK